MSFNSLLYKTFHVGLCLVNCLQEILNRLDGYPEIKPRNVLFVSGLVLLKPFQYLCLRSQYFGICFTSSLLTLLFCSEKMMSNDLLRLGFCSKLHVID